MILKFQKQNSKNIQLFVFILISLLFLVSCSPFSFSNKKEAEKFSLEKTAVQETETSLASALNTQEASTPTDMPQPSPTATNTPDPIVPIIATPDNKALGEVGSVLDRYDMVYIPAGEFVMGVRLRGATIQNYDEKPQREIFLDGFWIDRLEVTNAKYALFLNVMGNQIQGDKPWLNIYSDYNHIHEVDGEWFVDPGYEDYPVVEVNWFGARSYCVWAGKRLPTEAQWEKAARGTDERTFPWGEEFHCGLANYRGCSEGIVPVGSYLDGASPYGVLDMAGNVSEWVADWYQDDIYQIPALPNPLGPDKGIYRVFRGGNCMNGGPDLRVTHRYKMRPIESGYYTGFRCAITPE
jgi:formylglycine-generating enzyme required for sulfatase activity